MIIRKSFKYRIYPNNEQQQALAVQFGCARFVYNYYRAKREQIYKETGKGMSWFDCINDMVALKKQPEYGWLREASSQVLQLSLKDLNRAYVNFFEGRTRYPRFKSKDDHQSVRYSQRLKVGNNQVYVPKIGWVKAIFHRPVEGKVKNLTVSKTKSGKYFASISCEVELADPQPRGGAVGIDLGLKDFVTLSTGEKVEAPKYLRKAERRLKIRQRRLSRKQKGSNNRKKARVKVAIQYEKIANQRKDFHHKLSHNLVSRFGFIAFENLNVNGLLQNRYLAKSVQDAGWSQFIDFCQYKADWTGGKVEKQERFFASSKTCSDCGWINQGLTLNDRGWTCLGCGSVHDRDENAAKNLLKKSTVGVTESYALGDTIPVEGSAQETRPLGVE